MKKIIKVILIALAIFNLTFCKNEEKLNVNDILGILLLKKIPKVSGKV